MSSSVEVQSVVTLETVQRHSERQAERSAPSDAGARVAGRSQDGKRSNNTLRKFGNKSPKSNRAEAEDMNLSDGPKVKSEPPTPTGPDMEAEDGGHRVSEASLIFDAKPSPTCSESEDESPASNKQDGVQSGRPGARNAGAGSKGRGRFRRPLRFEKDFHFANYKTEICRSHQTTGYCEYEENCQFAHGIEELRPRQYGIKYKTQLCKNYHSPDSEGNSGRCRFGSRCKFIHDEQRLQVAEKEFWLISPSENLVRVEIVANEARRQHLQSLIEGTTPAPAPVPMSPMTPMSPVLPMPSHNQLQYFDQPVQPPLPSQIAVTPAPVPAQAPAAASPAAPAPAPVQPPSPSQAQPSSPSPRHNLRLQLPQRKPDQDLRPRSVRKSPIQEIVTPASSSSSSSSASSSPSLILRPSLKASSRASPMSAKASLASPSSALSSIPPSIPSSVPSSVPSTAPSSKPSSKPSSRVPSRAPSKAPSKAASKASSRAPSAPSSASQTPNSASASFVPFASSMPGSPSRVPPSIPSRTPLSLSGAVSPTRTSGGFMLPLSPSYDMGVGPHYLTPLQVPIPVMTPSAPQSPLSYVYYPSGTFGASSAGPAPVQSAPGAPIPVPGSIPESVPSSPLPVAFTPFASHPAGAMYPTLPYSISNGGLVGVQYPLEYHMQNMSLQEIPALVVPPNF